MEINRVFLGNSLDILKQYIPDNSIHLIYADPPFGTQSEQSTIERDTAKKISYADKWDTREHYLASLRPILLECKRILDLRGAIFLHCDWRMNHHIRVLMDDIFGEKNFRNEIIWSYRRWTNNTDSLQKLHQTIFYYAASPFHQMNPQLTGYSSTTNLDQIWQARTRDKHGKSVYATDENGEHLAYGKAKQGVPLGDVWDIPYLNPKARERVGYPSQKPVELLTAIIDLASQKGDVILDPFCGSGTTLVAASLKDRGYIGIDISEDAIRISQQRLLSPIVSQSLVVKEGRASFLTRVDDVTLHMILTGLKALRIHRNKNLDGFLTQTMGNLPVGLRVLLDQQPIESSIEGFVRSLHKKKCVAGILVHNQLSDPEIATMQQKEKKVPVLFVSSEKVLANPQLVLDELEQLLSTVTEDIPLSSPQLKTI